MLDFLVYVLAVVGAHRLWNFEDVFRAPREWLLRRAWAKPLVCQACNAFWIAAAIALAAVWLPPQAATGLWQVLAAYAVVRGVMWAYRMGSHGEAWLRARAAPARPTYPPRGAPAAGAAPALPAAPAAEKPCLTCAEKKAALIETQQETKKYERRIVILTTLSHFSLHYSLTSVICDHARMLAHNPAWWVEIWVHEKANLDKVPTDFPPNVRVRQIVPQIAWQKDVVVAADRDRYVTMLRTNLMALGNATVISHDILFQSSYTTFAAAVHAIGALPGFAWLHVCHSAVLGRPIGNAAARARTSLPPGHKLLCLSEAERLHLAAYYDTLAENVLVCPNARDVTAFGAIDSRVRQLIHQCDLSDADVVQIFPVAADRLTPKGVPLLVDLFAALHGRGLKVRLVLVTASSNGLHEKQALTALRARALAARLPDEALVITGEMFPETAAEGFSSTAVRDLFLVGNLFAFPTISEASSLVLLEAAMSGALLVVNESLHTMAPLVKPINAIMWPFGSLRSPNDQGFDAEALAGLVELALMQSMVNRSKRDVLRRFSLKTIGAQLRGIVEEVKLSPIK